ncbi:long-chain fatty acid--CoA ligase [Natranaerofaba carboxydovora]|uniref:long-chain fatty acid--CoA ligase n=1 Tax=Natranaerofaba carboxydovora TaxID=2742683 RepID=UPI001F12A291|nr:long-chain fatty acid--CoA ligase [Natranaerofaba carboxydovora]UMZ72739.1 Long-chain-fatty-acid--CoA ligase [Natranaerofaba carboxydovora]
MMMDYQLTLKTILSRAKNIYSKKEVISRDYSEDFKYTYGDMYERVKKLGNVLEELGVKKGDKIGTLAWNNHRHLEIYFAVPMTGAILHTLNLRLSAEQLAYVINHGEDKVIFVDKDVVPLLEAIQDHLKTVEKIVIMSDTKEVPENNLKGEVFSYEALLEKASSEIEFPDLDEKTPAAMCYTTATTGNPKGVVYTHRSIVLHCFSIICPEALDLHESDCLMPFVPMFHVNAWGLPYAATWVGANQVYPGSRPDPETVCRLMDDYKVTLGAGVPTIWMGTYPVWEQGKYEYSHIRGLVCGGSAAPRHLIKGYSQVLGIPIIHAYGMTETSPLVLASKPKSYMQDLDEEEKINIATKQGLLVPGLEMKAIDDEGNEIKWDGTEMGELLLKGPWIAGEYYKEPEKTEETIKDGWLHTGDIVTIDQEGYVKIVDRAKDLIKSGGEWISSVDLENIIMTHPNVKEAAVISVPHEKWIERPMAFVVLDDEGKDKITEKDILEHIEPKVSRIWVPDKVEFIDEIPKTSVGKFSKRVLREKYVEEE